jgi:hypothetical protein
MVPPLRIINHRLNGQASKKWIQLMGAQVEAEKKTLQPNHPLVS